MEVLKLKRPVKIDGEEKTEIPYELEKLTGHGGLEARDMRDAVSDLGHDGGRLAVDRGTDGSELPAEGVHDLLRADGVRHFSSPPMNEEESVFLMFASWARTEAS